MKTYKYIETEKTLNSRIQFNKMFGNFDLDKFIQKKFRIKTGQNILDLGCGYGKYTKLFLNKIGPNGKLISIDKNFELIKLLKNKIKKKNLFIARRDFDEDWKINEKIDWFFSIYSIQYTKNFTKILKKINKISKENTKIVFLGPGKENSIVINKIHKLIFKTPAPELYIDRMKFIETIGFKELKKKYLNKKITLTKHNYQIKFRNYEDFARYYWSTPLWKDAEIKMSKKTIQEKKKITLKIIKKMKLKKLKKQTVCLFCR